MAEVTPEHMAAKAASQGWLLSIANFGTKFELLNVQLNEQVADWKMAETVAILRHWCGTLTEQREDMIVKSTACPPSEAKTNLDMHINDNFKYEVNMKARISVAEHFMERSNQNEDAPAANSP